MTKQIIKQAVEMLAKKEGRDIVEILSDAQTGACYSNKLDLLRKLTAIKREILQERGVI